jgi:hypothetical protein
MIINFIINSIQSHQLRLGYPIPTRIAHHDGAERDLCYANNDANWHYVIVDYRQRLGEQASLALDSGGNPHIVYKSSNGLIYAWR